MSDAIIRWEVPPPHGNNNRRRENNLAIAEALRAAPGEWAVVAEGVPAGTGGSLASRIKRGVGVFTPAGAFESRCVTTGPGVARVHARYVGSVNA